MIESRERRARRWTDGDGKLRSVAVASLGAAVLALAVWMRCDGAFDLRMGGVPLRENPSVSEALWEVVTHTVTGPALLSLILCGAAVLRAPRGVTRLVLAQALGGVAVALIKVFDFRTRPDSGDGSWPSGHTASAFLFALSVAAALPVGLRGRRFLVAALWSWAAAVGWSRVALGFHWPSDVLAGASLALLVHAGTRGLRWSLPARWLRPEVLRVVLALAFVLWSGRFLVDPFSGMTPRAWAGVFFVFTWFALESRSASMRGFGGVQTVRRRGAWVVAGCAFALALVGSGTTELWTAGEARALLGVDDAGGWLASGVRSLVEWTVGPGSLAERFPSALALGLAVPAAVGVSRAFGLSESWAGLAAVVLVGSVGLLTCAHLATGTATRGAEALWCAWAAAIWAKPGARVRGHAVRGAVSSEPVRLGPVQLGAVGLALGLDLVWSGCWWGWGSALLVALVLRAPPRLAVLVAAFGAFAALLLCRIDALGAGVAFVLLGFLPWWGGFLRISRAVVRTPGPVSRGLTWAALTWTLGVLSGAPADATAVATLPGLSIALAGAWAECEGSAGHSGAGRLAWLAAPGIVCAQVGLAVWTWSYALAPAARLALAPTLPIVTVLWCVGSAWSARRFARGAVRSAVLGTASTSAMTAALLVGTVWPFAMRDSMSRQIVHGAAVFSSAETVLTVAVDPGPLGHYVPAPLRDGGTDPLDIVEQFDRPGVGLLVELRRLPSLRGAAEHAPAALRRLGAPTARFEGFVPHLWERQTWLWFAPGER